MKDTIIKLFNLEPSELQDIEIVSTDYSVHAIITLRVKRQNCPNCGCTIKRIHDYNKRTLTHAVINGKSNTRNTSFERSSPYIRRIELQLMFHISAQEQFGMDS